MAIRIIGRNKTTAEIDTDMTVADMFKKLKLSEQSFVCIRSGIPLVGKDTVSPNDDLSILEIFSGG